MITLSLAVGVLLILLGVVSYAVSGGESATALIPAAVGLVMAVLGLVARKESARRHAMHAASAVALLGTVGSFSGIPKLITLLGGGEIERPAAAIAQTIMALLCALFLIHAIRSFILARRNAAR